MIGWVMGVPENIDALLVMHDLPAYAIAEIAGVSSAAVHGWRNGAMPRKEPLEKLCSYFGLTMDDLLSDEFGLAAKEHGRYGVPLASDDAFVDVPVFGSIAAGTPIDAGLADGVHQVPRHIAERYPNGFLLKVRGESMNLLIPNGVYAYVSPCSDIDINNKPYAVAINGYDATIKLAARLANGIRLSPCSSDPTYRVQVFDYDNPEDESVTVIGRVVYHVLPYDWEY
ncbi:helix-turn-helix domain-containing protein [Eggerthellaceae bacterium zg-997]|nr:helix-turn-helix domain-containing protein [Eggerthellaceae bacterium zg-997]